MVNISRGPTLGDFVTFLTERSSPDVMVARSQAIGQSKYSLRNTKEKGVVGESLYIIRINVK